jgi:hypothetical protein
VVLTAGGSLTSLNNSKVGAVRSWTFRPWQFPVIVDSMMIMGRCIGGPRQSCLGPDCGDARSEVTANPVSSDGSTHQAANFGDCQSK